MTEQTIVLNQSRRGLKPLVTKADEIQYLKNPENGHISTWLATFPGYLGY